MSKDLSISVLMDFYGELLTEKQKDTLDLYYNSDLSLAEIAQDIDISRQGVRDFIKRGEKQLLEFEEKLGMVSKYNSIGRELSLLYDEVMAVKGIDSAKKAEILKRINSIKSSL